MAAIHPIERNDYLILTKPIDRIMHSLVGWIDYNVPGAMAYGQRRRGKTWCIRFVKKHLSDVLGYPIAVAVVCVRRHDIPTESLFLSNVLDALGMVFDTNPSKERKIQLIKNKLVSLARRCPKRKVVVVFDDAQRLKPMHFEVLMTIFNEMEEEYHVNLFTLLVGQPELRTQKDLFVTSGQLQLVARVMSDEVEFTGLLTLEETEKALDRYDSHSFWPRGSGVSYTAYYAKDAYAAGWRLRSIAKPLRDEYIAQREAMGITPVDEIPMHALTGMAHLILRKYASKLGFTGLSADDLNEVVRGIGYLQNETRADRDTSEAA